jgi:hypothetical protein
VLVLIELIVRLASLSRSLRLAVLQLRRARYRFLRNPVVILRATSGPLLETKRSDHLRLRLPNAYNVRPTAEQTYRFSYCFGPIPSRARRAF